MAYHYASRTKGMTARTYRVIYADGHGLAPVDLWDRYMDPEHRDRAPAPLSFTMAKSACAWRIK